MALDPLAFSRFGGLVLNQPLDEIGGETAIDLLDVDWDGSDGTFKSRQGTQAFTAEAGVANYESLFPHSDTRLLARRGGTTLVVFANDGKEIAAKTATVKELHMSFARIGTPAASYTYIADRENTLKRYDGTSFAEPTATVDGAAGKAMPKGQFLATWTSEGNRLVIAGTAAAGGPNGATSGGSHVWFAKPGEAESYESKANVQLNPGDGENIVGCCAWGGKIFVFKETHLFVFYGISANSAAEPVFNFDTVDLGTRILPAAVKGSEQAIAGGEGVYFVSNDGLWATTGGEPALLSEELDPLRDSQALIGPVATTLGERRWTQAKGLCFFGEAIYVGLGETMVDRLLKFNLRTLRWTVYSAELYSMAAWNKETTTHRMRLFFSASDAEAKGIYFYTPAKDTDPTATMEPRWQSGFYDAENPDEKTLTNVKLWGTGTVNLKVAEDFGSLGAATAYALGAGTVIAQAQQNKSQSATLFSHQLSGTAPWSVQRIVRYRREDRAAGTKKS